MTRWQRELEAAVGGGYHELSAAISRAVAAVVPHDGVRLVGTGPATGFGPGAFSFWHRYHPAYGLAVLRNAFAGQDRLLMPDLARQPSLAGVRQVGTLGVGSELRLLLRDGRGTWGSLELLRAEGGRPFDAHDVARVTQLGPALIAVLRGHVTAAGAPVVPALPAGVLVVGRDHAVKALTPEALRWRDLLQTRQHAPDFTSAAYCLGLSVLARRPGAPAMVVGPAASYGRWVACHAAPLTDGDVAIVIETITGARLLPWFCGWYGITAREQQVAAEVLDGAAPKQIARRLDLSAHTVHDHLKSLFRKTHVSSRDEFHTLLTS
ncbi:helix-turn-helix transcriptional regulator [Amycolatopsis sp. 195334CR]|uniref:helix-turn-helix domain-containing protein n=1 Tax=Amycolatopsis sp. 195334CR TaxID=2814588 RepID=UPI001A8F9A94|nr:helix-turn-helix transcriptional regulator [Amycolatopsis sp. 195334CR]MBN6033505.1 helix-turn-helix transcriptional regulator [Amycolatopsis sp. 195334CR]